MPIRDQSRTKKTYPFFHQQPVPVPASAAEPCDCPDCPDCPECPECPEGITGTLSVSAIGVSENGYGERGQLLQEFFAGMSYSSPPVIATVISSYPITDPSDVYLDNWTVNSPYTNGFSSEQALFNNGPDDPYGEYLLYAAGAIGPVATDRIYHTFRLYDGLVDGALTSDDIGEAELLALENQPLQRDRILTTVSSPTNQKRIRAFPDYPQWTDGTIAFNVTFDPYFIVNVTNTYGVACDYRVYLESSMTTGVNLQLIGT